jgi:hypothetical protein
MDYSNFLLKKDIRIIKIYKDFFIIIMKIIYYHNKNE